MEQKQENTRRGTTPEDNLVNYMPGMPNLSAESSRVQRFLSKMFRRRGKLRPVFEETDETVTTEEL